MSGLDLWLQQATRKLSRDSAQQVGAEIREHYESALESALSAGASPDEAGRQALAALGDARSANREYRKVLLTSGEARLLRESNWEARVFCSRGIAKFLVFCVPVLTLYAAAVVFRSGDSFTGSALLIGGLAMGFLFFTPFLPIYTASRGRIVRFAKWVVIAVAMTPLLALGSHALAYSWLFFAVLWPVIWVERTRISIRRKLPLAQWPKHLYL
jgi:hypothetical protein